MMKARFRWCFFVFLIQLTATSSTGVALLNEVEQEEEDLHRRLGFAQWKSRFVGGKKEGTGIVISNPDKDTKADIPRTTDTTPKATITTVKRTGTSTAAATSTTTIMSVKRSPSKWYMRAGTKKKAPTYTQKSMQSMK